MYAGGGFINSVSAPASMAYYACVFNGSSSGLYRNGASAGTGNVGTGGFTGGMVIGSDTLLLFEPLLGDVPEVAVYDSALGSIDLGMLAAYASAKYAL